MTTEEGHLLVYGLREYIFGMHKSAFVKDLVDEADGAIVVAHPYRRVYRESAPQDSLSYEEMLKRAMRNQVFELVDAVEISNGRGSERENLFSKNLSERLELPGTGASDAHKLNDIGTFATLFQDEIRSLQEFISAIKSGKFRAYKFRPFEDQKTEETR